MTETAAAALRRRRLERYLCQLRDLMRLQAWDIEVVAKPPEDEEAVLTINPHSRRHWAPVRIGSFFDAETDREEQRQTCVHELLHLVQADLWEWVNDGAWKLPLAPDVARAIEERISHQLEVQADFLARLIAPSMPAVPDDWDG